MGQIEAVIGIVEFGDVATRLRRQRGDPPVHSLTARPALRERFFSAYWVDGVDLNDSRLIEAIGGDRRDGPTVRRWQDEWSALPQPIVPVMVLPDGYVSRGLGALARLARMTNDPREIDG